MNRLPLAAFALIVTLLPAAAEDEKLKPVALPVNTAADEDDPHVFDGGLSLIFTRGVTEGDGIKDEFFLATRKVAGGVWGKPKVLEDYVSTSGDDRGVYATDASKKAGNFDLYVAVKQDAGLAWSAPTPVMNVNTKEDELHPCVSPDGKSLYFSRKSEGGWKQMVTARAAAKGPGGWQEPADAGLPAGFHHAALTPDGKTMYLQGPLEKGRLGLFVARADGKSWTKPQPLAGVNDESGKVGDRAPSLSRDGRFLYFASDRAGGKGGLDLYYVPTASLESK
ncbi:MAG: TolB family protein [Gemmataceae bacterium]